MTVDGRERRMCDPLLCGYTACGHAPRLCADPGSPRPASGPASPARCSSRAPGPGGDRGERTAAGRRGVLTDLTDKGVPGMLAAPVQTCTSRVRSGKLSMERQQSRIPATGRGVGGRTEVKRASVSWTEESSGNTATRWQFWKASRTPKAEFSAPPYRVTRERTQQLTACARPAGACGCRRMLRRAASAGPPGADHLPRVGQGGPDAVGRKLARSFVDLASLGLSSRAGETSSDMGSSSRTPSTRGLPDSR
ncbi:hypothetical protein SALBM217S_05800 [Streptomyces griseoloalbus]